MLPLYFIVEDTDSLYPILFYSSINFMERKITLIKTFIFLELIL